MRNTCPKDPVGPPSLNENTRYPIEDAVYVTLLLASPANITITSGNAAAIRFLVEPGVQSVQVSALPGTQRFVVSRGATLLANVTGSERINSTAESVAVCNAQTFTGSEILKPLGLI